MTEDLVRRAKMGDQEALVKLIMTQRQDYYKLAYVYMKNKEDALDAMEDMIVSLYENIHQLKSEKAFYTWSKTILVNRCKALLKDKNKIIPLLHIQEEAHEGDIHQKDEEMALEKHLSQLHDKYQEILRLRYFLDLEYETIAHILKIPLGTVKSRIHTGLKKLKESLGGEEL